MAQQLGNLSKQIAGLEGPPGPCYGGPAVATRTRDRPAASTFFEQAASGLSESVTTSVKRLAMTAGRRASETAPDLAVALPGPLVPHVRFAHFGVRRAWKAGPERALEYLLVHVQEGRVALTVEGVEQAVPRGAFCFIQPGDLMTMEAAGDTVTPYVQLDLFYHPARDAERPSVTGLRDVSALADLLQPRLNDLPGIKIPSVLRPADPVAMASTLTRIIAAWLQGDVLSRLEAQNLAGSLALMILRDHAPALGARPTSAQPLAWVPAYMAVHLGEQLTVREMARRAGLSSSRFARVFRERFGESPHRFLLSLRVRLAQDLLRETELSHERIAEHCGFADTFHFSKVFKRRTGMAPRVYRQLNRREAAAV